MMLQNTHFVLDTFISVCNTENDKNDDVIMTIAINNILG